MKCMEETDWSEWDVSADGATISDEGFYTCEKCDNQLEPVSAQEGVLWDCSECCEKWLFLSRKQVSDT